MKNYGALLILFLATLMCRQPAHETDILFRTGTSSAGGETIPPTIGTGLAFSNITTNSLTVSWGAASDNITAASNLQYKLVKATAASAIDTVAKIESITGPDLLLTYTANVLSKGISSLSPSTTYYFAVAVRDDAGNVAAYSVANAKTRLALTSSTPTNGATTVQPCSGNPCTAKIILVFSETMNIGLTQNLTTEIHNGSGYVSLPNTGTVYTWGTTTSTNDTLTINLSWKWFPENALTRYTLLAAGLADLSGNPISADLQQTFETTTANQVFAVPDTGQTLCYDTSTNIACTGSGGTYPNQDADFANTPNARSFSGPTQHGTYTSDYTTTDNVSTLIWRACSEGLSGATCATGAASTMTWYNAINQCAALNTANSGAGYAGRTTWHLPTISELKTLPNYGNNNPAIDAASFPNTTTSTYWTATESGGGPSLASASAWAIPFDSGRTIFSAKTTTNYVRCVSTPSIVTRSLTNNGDGTVTDSRTNLVWNKTLNANSTWAQALTTCKNATLGGRSWRLPSIGELMSIGDYAISSPALDPTYFSSNSSYTWSATTFSSTNTIAFAFNENAGGIDNSITKNNTSVSSRCVANGP